ncbi:MAG: UDP-N-acetylmuramoyl-L-alanyl-D-glutamate--2,6-diaminopimelate ligase [Alphaproteobacteria bacterium]
MRLSELINGHQALGRGVPPEAIEIRGLAADSRAVGAGFLFAALKGNRADGKDFIGDAIARGAVAVLAPPEAADAVPRERVQLVVDAKPRRRLAQIAARFYPTQPDVIAAVTGTNGKTSVAWFLRRIWSSMGRCAASLGTLGVVADSSACSLPNTTPDPVTLHRLLSDLAARGVDRLAVEASSHGLDQHRLDAVRVTAAAFTNLSQDHLDYHSSAEAYEAAKFRLFGEVMAPGGPAVLNADSPAYGKLATLCRARGHRVLSFGTVGRDLRLKGVGVSAKGLEIAFELSGAPHRVTVPLAGRFQASNVLCALGLVLASGDSSDRAVRALSSLSCAPGRLEEVARHPSGGPIYVDYAHTPDALASVLKAVRPVTERRLFVVFGCGGDRDRLKRPIMGEIAATLADRVIVTDDNPRGEDPTRIRGEILAACPQAIEIGDRAAAIRAAVSELSEGDVLIVAGKGHEQGQVFADRVVPLDDAAVARAAVAALEEAQP